MAEGILPTSEEAKKQVILSRLPELAKILRMVFVNEKKGVLREDLVLTKVSHSFKEKLSTGKKEWVTSEWWWLFGTQNEIFNYNCSRTDQTPETHIRMRSWMAEFFLIA